MKAVGHEEGAKMWGLGILPGAYAAGRVLGMLRISQGLKLLCMSKNQARILGRAYGKVTTKKQSRKQEKNKIEIRAAAIILESAGAMARDIYLKPGINAYIQYLFHSKDETYEFADDHPASKWIVEFFLQTGFRPKRIGVDGLPGSGKSTLARSLSKKLNMQWVCLDHQVKDAPIDFSETNTIYEHHRLFRTQELDNFDVIIYLDEPLSKVREQIITRGRGAAMIEVFDFHKMREVGKKFFALAQGTEWRPPGTNVRLKTPSPQGFQDISLLDAELEKLGHQGTENLTKETKLFLALYGLEKSGPWAYVQTERIVKDLCSAVGKEVLPKAANTAL